MTSDSLGRRTDPTFLEVLLRREEKRVRTERVWMKASRNMILSSPYFPIELSTAKGRDEVSERTYRTKTVTYGRLGQR